MENLNKQIQELQKIIDTYGNIVFFGGAGVSTESGIPDFRSVDGLYHQQYDYPPETILSHTFYRSHTEEFFRFYRNKMLFPNAQPNAAHKKLAELEAAGKVRAVITQNIDGLHQAAGSRTVLELHGSVLRNYCENCYLLNEDDVCAFCGSRLTRGPKADDYCFIGTKTSPWAEMLQGILEDDHLPVIVRQWSPRTAAYTGEVGTRTDFFVPYRELDHARQLEQVLMDSSFEQPED